MPLQLVVTYWGGDRQVGAKPRAFSILAGGTEVGSETLDQPAPGQFFERAYPLHPSAGTTPLNVRIQARLGTVAGGVYGIRLVYGDGVP